MTLIDKAEALAALETVWRTMIGGAEVQRKVNAAIRALPARGVGVKPLVFRDETGDGVLTSRETGELFRIFPQHDGVFFAPKLPEGENTASDAQTLIDRYNARWSARILAALAPTDAAQVNETPKSEHDGADVLTAAQAREAALMEALDNKEQLDIWAQEILEGLGFADVLKIESYDDKIEAHSVIGRGIVEVLRALLTKEART